MDIAAAGGDEVDDDGTVCLDETFFVNRDYRLTTFTFGPHVLRLLCLQSASTDYDLTGQLVWPGAVLLNNYLSLNHGILDGLSAIELGSGVGTTGILCGRFCKEVLLTDHNGEVLEILKRNIELQVSESEGENDARSPPCERLVAEKLEWGNDDEIDLILENHPDGFDLVLGADICFQQSSIPPLFRTVKRLLRFSGVRGRRCKFLLAYVSRARTMDALVLREVEEQGMRVEEAAGTRSSINGLEGAIYEITSSH